VLLNSPKSDLLSARKRRKEKRLKGHEGTPILGQKGHGPRELLLGTSLKGHRPRALLKPSPQGHVILVAFCCPLGPWKNVLFFGFSKGVAAIIFQTNFRPKIWQSCTPGSLLMCSASYGIFGFSEMYFPDF
jgi:hypothetical protein